MPGGTPKPFYQQSGTCIESVGVMWGETLSSEGRNQPWLGRRGTRDWSQRDRVAFGVPLCGTRLRVSPQVSPSPRNVLAGLKV